MSRRTKRIVFPSFAPEPEPLHYGDIVCYIGSKHGYHDPPIMYISPCGHSFRTGGGPHLIDLISVADLPFHNGIEHKDPAMWQRCPHV